MNVLEKAQQALKHHTDFNGYGFDDQPVMIVVTTPEVDSLFELPHDGGQFNLSDFRTLVEEFAELKHRMDGLEK
jgi:hypothetical protein